MIYSFYFNEQNSHKAVPLILHFNRYLFNLSIFTVFLKNRNFISKIRRSKVTDYADYAALTKANNSLWKHLTFFSKHICREWY